MRIGYTRAARLIDEMEKRGFVGPYIGTSPREVLIKEFDPAELKQQPTVNKKERNAPKKDMERSINTERSEKVKSAPKVKEETKPEPVSEEEENDGFTPRQRLFVQYYLINFNATQAAIKAGYSSKAAKEVGYRLLTYVHIKEAIKKYNEEISFEIGMNVQRTIMKYMKIAFSDITEFVEFGQKDELLFTDEGPAIDRETGEQITYKRNFVAFKESSAIDGTLISEVKQGKDGVGIKLHDKMKALEVLTKYHDLLPDHHKRMVDNEKLKLERERLEFDKVKAAGGGDLDEELIDDWVSGVMGDE
jgi:phage terminase small subunit